MYSWINTASRYARLSGFALKTSRTLGFIQTLSSSFWLTPWRGQNWQECLQLSTRPAHPGHQHRRPASQSPPGRSMWRLRLTGEDTSPLPSGCLDSSHAGRVPAPWLLPEAVLALGCSNLAGPPSGVASGTSTFVSQPCLRGDSHTKRTVGLGAVASDGTPFSDEPEPRGDPGAAPETDPATRSATSGRCWQGRHHHVRPWACAFRTRSRAQCCL